MAATHPPDGRAGAEARRVRPRDLGALDQLLYEGEGDYARDWAAERLAWIREATRWHVERSASYANLCRARGFAASQLEAPPDLVRVPVISSGSFKRAVFDREAAAGAQLCRSSGTGGTLSIVPRDRQTLERFVGGVGHALREFLGVSERRRAVVLGPTTAEAGDLWFSYVLSLVNVLYDTRFFVRDDLIDLEGALEALETLPPGEHPLLVAPPGLLLDLLDFMDESELRLDLSAREPYVVTAGGWKDRQSESIPRSELEKRVELALGIPPSSFRDAYNMVEMNSVIFECRHGRKHVPPWLEVVVRRPRDWSAAPEGEDGVLTFLDPTATSYPAFVASDDLGALSAEECACGRKGHTLRIARRISSVEERGCGLKMNRYRRRPA